MSDMLSEKDAVKQALLMQQNLQVVQNFFEQGLIGQETFDFYNETMREIADIAMEMAKEKPDEAKILGWTIRWTDVIKPWLTRNTEYWKKF